MIYIHYMHFLFSINDNETFYNSNRSYTIFIVCACVYIRPAEVEVNSFIYLICALVVRLSEKSLLVLSAELYICIYTNNNCICTLVSLELL